MVPPYELHERRYEFVIADQMLPEWEALDEAVQDGIDHAVHVLERAGPQVGRPHAAKLNVSDNSVLTRCREIRWTVNTVPWRAVFMIDGRTLVLLSVGSKAGYKNEDRFYRRLLKSAETVWELYCEQKNEN